MRTHTHLHDLWNECLAEIETTVSKANFNTWFKKALAHKEEDGVVSIAVPNEFIKEWLGTKYHKLILKTLRSRDMQIRNIEFVIGKTETSPAPQQPMHQIEALHSLPLQQLYINKKDNLNSRYTFTNFIIGPFNELAYSAGQAIINKPGVYNPLFIYGSTGLGKTHLIQAIGNALKERNPDISIYYTNSEKFTSDLVEALGPGQGVGQAKINAFKNKYRNYDVLIMDDIQFLGGRDKSQEELFHLFNILYDRNKQIIFSADKHPNMIHGLVDRLKSRFSAGMIVDILKPEYESRVAILRAKIREQETFVADEVIDYIAMNVEGNIRELEGILNSLLVQQTMKSRPVTVEEAKSLIKNNIKPKKHVSVAEIVKIISGFYSIDPELMYDKTRRKEVVHSRQVIMYILREDFNISYPLIGKEMGGRDHTTVIHSHLKVRGELENNSLLTRELEQIRAMLST